MPRTKGARDKSPRRVVTSKFTPICLVHVYRYARQNLTNAAIGVAMGLSKRTVDNWCAAHPEVREALALARTEAKNLESFASYCYSRLPMGLRELWDRIQVLDGETNGVNKIEAMLADHGETVRQQLYLHALVHCHFSPTRAMHKVNIKFETVRRWKESDPDFADLCDQILRIKGDFFEESLVSLVAAGDTSATIFANRSFNRDRGYGTVTKVDVTGSISHTLEPLDLDELLADVSLQARTEVLHAIRKREERRLNPPPLPEQIVLEQIQERVLQEGEG